MTSIPVAGVRFDFVVFYSVFTHTFPEETALLSQEAHRLLADGGIIFADVFTSPLVERHSGNRGAVEVNKRNFREFLATKREAEKRVIRLGNEHLMVNCVRSVWCLGM